MKVVVQRVKYARCIVDNNVISEIKDGLLVLFGACTTDTLENVSYIAKKIANLRVFSDEEGKMNKSVLDLNYSILNISQFTLYGDVRKGNRPSFTEAKKPDEAVVLYHALTEELKNYNITTLEGQFGADMKIELLNDGPVTIIIEN